MNSLNIFDTVVASRDPAIWTPAQTAALRLLVTAYINGDERDAHLDAISDLVPPRTPVDPDSSRSVFGTWLQRRAHRTTRRLAKLE